MLMSSLFGRTLREVPAEAEHESHRLMPQLRLVEQTRRRHLQLHAPWLPRPPQIEPIVREEMDDAGGQES